jgi:hypothetical protein
MKQNQKTKTLNRDKQRQKPSPSSSSLSGVAEKDLVTALESLVIQGGHARNSMKDCQDSYSPEELDGVYIRLKSGSVLNIKLLDLDEEDIEQIFG